MIEIESFLKYHIFKGNEFWDYQSDDYNYIYRDRLIDYKYVEFTIEKPYPGGWLNFTLEYRKCTLGKYLKKAFNKLTPAQITHICEKVKSILLEPANFKVIEGSDIKDAYYRVNYVPSHGTLNNSCMRYLKCQRNDYFKIYEDNAKMIIMTPKRGKRILGRAILWPYGDTYLMDRVYSVENYIEHQFYEYAKQQGWGVLEKNAYAGGGCVQRWKLPEDNYKEAKELRLEIKLSGEYENYPYLDSFYFLSDDKTTLRTFPVFGLNYILKSTEGGKQFILWR